MNLYDHKQYARTHVPLDYHSLLSVVNKGMEMDCCNFRQKDYYDRYADDCHRLANYCGYLYNDMEQLAHDLGSLLPYRRYRFQAEDELAGSGIKWFNYATAWLPDSNIDAALENEEEHGILYSDNIWSLDDKIRKKRQNAVAGLPKDQVLMLMVSVCGMVVKVTEVREGMNTLSGLVDELEVLQNVIVGDDGTVIHHPAAYIQEVRGNV